MSHDSAISTEYHSGYFFEMHLESHIGRSAIPGVEASEIAESSKVVAVSCQNTELIRDNKVRIVVIGERNAVSM